MPRFKTTERQGETSEHDELASPLRTRFSRINEVEESVLSRQLPATSLGTPVPAYRSFYIPLSLITMLLRFFKMNGAGNDFIIIDNRDLTIDLDADTIAALCDRNRGIGADGLLAVEPAQKGADFRFRYYNADGLEAEMCGNGARCFGRFTAHLGEIILKKVTFETMAGTLSAEMIGENVRIAMSEPKDLKLNAKVTIDGLDTPIHSVNTGVPHIVTFLASAETLDQFDVFNFGEAIRNHPAFTPAGTNANFAAILAPNHISIRTFERGVEDETLACGTGMVASALVHHLLTGARSPILVDVEGGDTLEIGFEKSGEHGFSNVTLTGPADFVFEGEIEL
jgi:diaminopimelate epimerase